MTSSKKLTTGAAYLKRGYRSDPEDWRMTHRLQLAQMVLRDQGYELTQTHRIPDVYTPGVDGGLGSWTTRLLSPEEFAGLHLSEVREHRAVCGDACPSTWSNRDQGSEVGDEPPTEVFNTAFAFACAIQDHQHEQHQRFLANR